MVFDPPANATVIEANKITISELESRLLYISECYIQ